MNQTIALPTTFAPVPVPVPVPVPYDENRDAPFIALESVSGVGKSTLTAELAHRWGGTGIHTLAPPHSGWSREADRMKPLPHLAFYLSDRIRQSLAIGPVIADRYASSITACQAAVHGADIAEVDRLIAPFRPYLVVPDHTFYLRCSEETLRERMAVKGDTKQDDADLFAIPGRLKQLTANFEAVANDDPTAIVLDTDGLTPDDLANLITAHLESHRA
ncbi:dTMP kinase [Streptomyces sp. NBC_01233]|uniref:dTMP kinase n=1 Tax=Streptomyces sp. NBC_01233 TaxID=2903787 RepID=UPI002E166569|nr:thymidylate kinase [Streptomyces sp. NBC_01233]